MMISSKLESEMDLVGRHMKILKQIIESQPIGIIKLSQMVNIPEHKVRYTLRVLEQERLIEPSPEGARPTKKVKREIKAVRQSLEKIVDDANKIISEIKEIENM